MSDQEMYPIAVVQDRYGGCYSRGAWLAISKATHLENGAYRIIRCLDGDAHGDDGDAEYFWRDPPEWIAAGNTPEEAIANLRKKLHTASEPPDFSPCPNSQPLSEDVRAEQKKTQNSQGEFAEIKRILRPMAVSKAPGKLLYSSWNTLKPGDLYVLGFNPGGDPLQENVTVERHLSNTPASGWTEYENELWMLRQRTYERGKQPTQIKIQEFFRILGRIPSEVLCTNLIFVREATVNKTRYDPLFRRYLVECAKIHRYMLDVVRPKLIICFGNDAYGEFRRMRLGDGAPAAKVVKVPHFSRGSKSRFYAEAERIRPLIASNA